MKIAFNCRSFLKKKRTGIGRYAYHLVKEYKDLNEEDEFFLYTPKNLFDSKRKDPHIKAPHFIVKRDYFRRGVNATMGKVDVYHSPCPELLEDPRGYKTIVTVHDLIFKTCPNVHTERTIQMLEKQMDSIVAKADRIICISKSTADDLIKFYKVKEDKIRLIYNGVDKHIFYVLNEAEKQEGKAVLKAKGVEDPFLLFVGTIEPRKNLRGLLEAYKMLKERGDFKGKVVVVGMKGWLSDGLEDFINQLGIQDDVLFLGYVTNAELRYLYNLCTVFLFPSFYEGFGFPIVEAFSCGAAVVTSNVSSPLEIAGDCAITIDPSDPEQMALAVKDLVKDPEKRNELKERGKKRSGLFSFKKTAEETWKVYQEFKK